MDSSVRDIVQQYIKAAKRLRAMSVFSTRRRDDVKFYNHHVDTSRQSIHPDAARFASQINLIVDQVSGENPHPAFQSDFVVNLEAFATFADRVSTDSQRLPYQLAYYYCPLRLSEFLRHTKLANKKLFYRVEHQYDIGGAFELFGLGASFDEKRRSHDRRRKLSDLPRRSSDKRRPPRPILNVGNFNVNLSSTMVPRGNVVHYTRGGPRISRSVGVLTSTFVVLLSSIPVLVYLVIRIGKADVEDIIQTALAIAAGTLLIIASPLHRIIYNNWSLSEAISGRMTLDEDTVGNIQSKEERREVGIGLIVKGYMDLISREATYASPYSDTGLDPGPMPLGILTLHPNHKLVVDINGALVLIYGDGKAIQLSVRGTKSKEGHLKARPYKVMGHYYVLNADGGSDCLVA